MGVELDSRHVLARILELADEQHRVVARQQLLALGLTRASIETLIGQGWLTPVHRGVYAVGTRRLTRCGRWMAAVLACGEGAALSGRAAADLWGFHDSDGRVCVTVPTHAGRVGRPGFRIRRSTSFEYEVERGIRVTTVAWTLVDLATELRLSPLLNAIDEAERLRLWSWDRFDDLAKRRSGARGIGQLARARALRDPLAVKTRGQLARDFLVLCRRFGLPLPEIEVELFDGRYYADFLWRQAKLIAETDGRESHGTAAAFEKDRERDAYLASNGYQTLRFTWRQVQQEPAIVAQRIRNTLRIRGVAA